MDLNYFLLMIYQGFLDFSHSTFFSILKFFILIYITVLFANIIMLLILRGIGADWRQSLRGIDMPTTSQGKMIKKWNKVKTRLKSENTSQYKAAVLEADAIANEILKGIGLEGNNMSERLQKAQAGQLENVEDLLRAHAVRNRIIHEKDFIIEKDEAREIIKIYENFLKYLEFL